MTQSLAARDRLAAGGWQDGEAGIVWTPLLGEWQQCHAVFRDDRMQLWFGAQVESVPSSCGIGVFIRPAL